MATTTNKVIVGFGSLAAVAAIAFAGSSAVLAESENGQGSLADKLATRFNLNKDEVQATLGEHRGQQRGVKQEANLSAAVEAGKITEEQKQAIVAKQQEIVGDREAGRGLNDEDRDAVRAEHRAAMEAWATENDVNLSELHDGEQGQGERKGMGGPDRR